MPGKFKPGTQPPRAAAEGNAPSSGPIMTGPVYACIKVGKKAALAR
jgi:hypothetical protein